ncbi:transglycosylase domain-containing protein, partial [Myxococcota bacterium]|nr:transglycosylase domain-containing protein [Myxococcota bacterium]MBU1538082.1 transglycosylase domain-containing protein [Myxococcota bacterium]
EGRFALTSFTLRHHLLAAGPVHWPLVSGEIAYSRLEQKEQLNAQFLVMGKAKGAVNIVKTNDNAVKIRGDIPVQPCATIFSVIPAALLPTINDMRLGGETGIHFVTHVPLNDLATLTAHMNFSGPGCFLNMASANVDIEKLKGTPTVTLTDQHGKRVTKLLDPKDPNFIPFEKLPYYLVDAVTTSEDMRFFKHDGFDWPLLVRALGINLSSGRVVKGASTITQQLAKNLFLSTTRSISRKLEESLITWQIERTLSKRRILEIYMNIIEMGPGLRGVNAGTELYFGKRATGISPLEAAHIASIIPAPSFYYQHFRGAPVKDDWSKKIRILLNKTARYGRLSAAMLKEAEKSELVIQDY